jgi:hypothetical protein
MLPHCHPPAPAGFRPPGDSLWLAKQNKEGHRTMFLSKLLLSGPRTTLASRKRIHPQVERLESRLVPSTISGVVYNDANVNGVYDPGEPIFPNNPLELKNAAGVVIAATVTDANGHYQFKVDQTIDTSPHTKEVDAVFDLAKTDFSRTATLDQFNPALGTLNAVEIIQDAQISSEISIKNLDNAAASVEGTVSGTVTARLPGVPGLVVSPSRREEAQVAAFDGAMDFSSPSGHAFGPKTAENSDSVTLDAATTDLSAYIGTGKVTVTEDAKATSGATGEGNLLALIKSMAEGTVRVIYHYTPSNTIQPGTYTIVQLQNPPGTVDGTNTTSDGKPVPPGTPPDTIPVTVVSGVDSANNNFGEIIPSSLGGFVYADVNDNGIFEPSQGDVGLGGVTVVLQGTDYHGNTVNQTTQTAADGSYSFSNLLPGTYSLTKTTTPPGFLDGKDSIGTQGGQVGVNTLSQIPLAQNVQGQNNNFAEVVAGQLSGHVCVQDTGAPLAGVLITLTGTDIHGQAVSIWEPTAADGSYTFNDLRAGSYQITETPPPGFLPGTNTVGTLGGSVNGNQFTLTMGVGAVGKNYDFCVRLPPPIPLPSITPNTPAPPTTPIVPVVPPAVPDTPAPPVAITPPSTPPPGVLNVPAVPSKRDLLGSDFWSTWNW